MERNSALSVTQLNSYVKSLIEGDSFLGEVAVSGELSNCKLHGSGHVYFTLKDASSEIAGVMFKSSALRLSFVPKNGMRVTVYGRVSVYEASGRYQVYANAMVAEGAGSLYEQFLKLKAKLEVEGLFDQGKKRPLPRFPKKIGIITSPTGAAIRDMINVTGRRFPSAEILICPALVQGAEAPADLCRALALMNAVGECDVLIIGRGGGSAEDLWAFNDELLVRAVAASETPIISAVGHETDTTLCDYAADFRAPTPSAAAEIAVPDKNSLLQGIDALGDRLDERMARRIGACRESLRYSAARIERYSPQARLSAAKEKLSGMSKVMESAVDKLYASRKLSFGGLVGQLEGVNPMAVIGRGYGMALDESGKVVGSVEQIEVGDKIKLILRDGEINTVVEEKTRKSV